MREGVEGSRRHGQLSLPATLGATITVLAHFYRAEIARMMGCRDRIDLTTNWAITVGPEMLSVSLSMLAVHHGVLIFTMVLVILLLSIEARRYRFFDVHWTRARRLERDDYAQVFAPRPDEEDWAKQTGDDLREPRSIISRSFAIFRGLRRNYSWMFLVLLIAWILKITSPWLLQDQVPVNPAKPVPGLTQNLALGPVPGWAVLTAVCVFYCWLSYHTFRPHEKMGEFAHGDVHV
jgi:uncharacterized membrane protein